MGFLGKIFNNAAKMGFYKNGYEDAMAGRPIRIRKPSNKEEYNQGYEDGMRERMLRSKENDY